MFRSLLTLLLLASLNTAPPAAIPAPPSFQASGLLTVESVPRKTSDTVAQVLEAKAALLMDLDSGTLLYEKEARKSMSVASLTKIMTALVILENHDLDEVVMVEEDYNQTEELGVRIWLNQYEKITVGNLLIGLLVRSAGDAAMALAAYHSGSVDAFVNEMNARAQMLHLDHTHFTNPIGLDDPDHYSSAFDLAILTKHALRYPDFRRIVRLPRAAITSTDGEITHEFESTNYLLESYLDIRGVKTGTTDEAGQSLINLARHRNGKEVIVVLLNSPERFQESKRLIDWVFRNFSW